ncbi:MAG: GNAT family N-acetyltransferase [Agriterribacter sp.]
MTGINFQIVKSYDQQAFILIADWYLSEWKIPVKTTIEKLQSISADEDQFQVLMTLDGKPIATGGVYNHVGLLDKVPELAVHKKWLALVYTVPEKRRKGYGAAICNYILHHAKICGIEKMNLFTDTAEPLYQRLGWAVTERLSVNNRNITVMEYALASL